MRVWAHHWNKVWLNALNSAPGSAIEEDDIARLNSLKEFVQMTKYNRLQDLIGEDHSTPYYKAYVLYISRDAYNADKNRAVAKLMRLFFFLSHT